MKKKIRVFCTGVVNGYHLANIYSLIDLEFSGYEVSLHVYVEDFWGRRIIPERYICYGKNKYNLKIEDKADFRNIQVSGDESYYVFVGVTYVSFLAYFNIRLRNKVINKSNSMFYSVDEGLGSHAYKYWRVMKRQFLESKNKLKFLLRYNIRYISSVVYDKFYSTNHNRLFYVNKNQVIINESFAKVLANCFKELASINEFSTNTHDLPKKIAIYLDQPLNDIGICTPEFENFHLPIRLNAFCKNLNRSLCVKAHPSRKQTFEQNYNFINIPSFDGCIEELLYLLVQRNHDIVVLGVTSNAMITAKILYNIESFKISCTEFNFEDLELSYEVKKSIDFFTKVAHL